MNSSFGSEWRKWDFHVHTPYSVLNNQFGLNANDPADFDSYVRTLFTKAIEKDIWAIGITDYFWRVSPSDKKTVKLCQSWVDYANAMQPYHQKIPFGAASMSYRLGNFKRAEQILLESQKLQQEELKVKQPGLLKNYTDMLRDIRNRKL